MKKNAELWKSKFSVFTVLAETFLLCRLNAYKSKKYVQYA